MAVDPRNPFESIDVKDTQPFRTEIARVKRQLFHLGEDYEDPKVLWKYYRNMAARYGDGFVIGRRQDGTLWSWGCSALDGQLGNGITPTATPTQVSISDVDFSRVFATGRAHTVALDVSGAPYTWGSNEWGQLGILPPAAKGAFGIGEIQGAAMDESGNIWTWGVNTHGNLGDGTWTTARSSPVTLIDAGPWATITNFPAAAEEFCKKFPGHCHGIGKTGGNFLWAINENGTLYTCGRSNFGQLGIGAFNTSRSSPVSVLGSGNRNFWQCCGGGQTMGCIDQSGEVWTWGRGSDGKLGIWGPVTGSPTSLNSPNNVHNAVFDNDPANFFNNRFIKNLSVGNNFMTALDTGGNGWAWGNNQNGQLGNDDDALQNSPQSVHQGGLIFIQTAAGVNTSMWLDIDGNVWMSGNNDFGRLAIVGDLQEVSVPTIVKGSPHLGIKVAAGTTGNNFGFLREDGSLWLWGENDTGQIGIGYDCPEPSSPPCDSGGTDMVTSPASVIGSGQSYKFVDFWMGGNHTIAIDEDGQLWGWGSAPQIGNNSPTGEFPSPVQVSLPAFGLNISNETTPTQVIKSDLFGYAAAAGWGHSLMIDENDKVWAWGGNWYGQLGDGTDTDRLSPVGIAQGDTRRFRKIDAGDEHSIALDQSGQIFTWGNNNKGQLGDDTTTAKSSPVAAGPNRNYMEVAAGSQSSYGIDVNGKLYSWGDNTYGQLGDGTTTDKSAPVSVSGRHSFIQVTGGGAVSEGHACALKPDGSVWCFGRNHHGQLGLCDYTDRSTPTLVVGNHSFIDIWASKDGYQTIAIKLDGSVWVWGKEPFCDGVDYCSPVSVPDFNLITLNILGRGYFQNHSNLLRFS